MGHPRRQGERAYPLHHHPLRQRAGQQRFQYTLASKNRSKTADSVTVTHPDIIRFFMTIPEACRLVMEAATMGQGNEILPRDGRSRPIVDLATRMIELAGYRPGEDIQIEFTGLRPGEKLYEEVLSNGGKYHTYRKQENQSRQGPAGTNMPTSFPTIRSSERLSRMVDIIDTVAFDETRRAGVCFQKFGV